MENLPSKTWNGHGHSHGRTRHWWRRLSDQFIPQWCIKREQESLFYRELKLKGGLCAPWQDWMLIHIPCARCWSIPSLCHGKLERLFPANCLSLDAGSENRKSRGYWVITSTVEPGITTHSCLSLRLIGFGFIPSNTIFCPYVTLPGVPSLPLWKGIHDYPYFLPGNTDSEWGEMDSSQGSASSRAWGPGPINFNA